jgi:hypothetical protein
MSGLWPRACGGLWSYCELCWDGYDQNPDQAAQRLGQPPIVANYRAASCVIYLLRTPVSWSMYMYSELMFSLLGPRLPAGVSD